MKYRNLLLTGLIVVSITGGSILSPLTADAAALTSGQKEEVVYIITDASGEVSTINVVNIWGKGKVIDYGDYSEVKMLTSTEDISLDGNKVTFTADSDRTYYQGTLKSSDIPWDIDISYTLDGKKILPDDLAGQSGALKIHIKITDSHQCTDSFYDNYALQAAFSLDTNKCSNIVAEGATLANVGADKQISYTILPGKGLDATIAADVVDFEMDAATINGVMLSLDVDVDDSQLLDKVSEIQDASGQFDDGARKLQEGTDSLKNGTTSLKDGATSLNDGASLLYDGTNSLNTGITSLNSGLTSLQSGVNSLNGKSANLVSGSASVKDAISQLYLGSSKLQDTISSSTSAMDTSQLDQVQQLVAGNTTTIGSLNAGVSQIEGKISEIKATDGYDNNDTLKAQVESLEQQKNTYLELVKLLQSNNQALSSLGEAAQSASDGLSSISTAVGQLNEGLLALNSNYDSLNTGIKDYTSAVSDIKSGVASLKEGADKLAAGSSELLSSTADLKDGTEELKEGSQSLDEGADSLREGTGSMKEKTAQFKDKTSNLDTQVEDKIEDMVSSISGTSDEVVSFVSDKNENVASVQFVIKTNAIEKEEEIEVVDDKAEGSSFIQKLIDLFKK